MDKQTPSRPRLETRTVLVIEVCRDRYDPPTWFQVLVSIAGKPALTNRVWPCESGRLSAPQLLDMVAYLDEAATDAVVTSVGVQLDLGVS